MAKLGAARGEAAKRWAFSDQARSDGRSPVMRGYEPLLRMRRKGLRPSGHVEVWLDEGGDQDWWRWEETEGHPEVSVERKDVIGFLDLRALRGLDVLVVAALWSERCGALVDAVQAVQPSSCLLVCLED